MKSKYNPIWDNGIIYWYEDNKVIYKKVRK